MTRSRSITSYDIAALFITRCLSLRLYLSFLTVCYLLEHYYKPYKLHKLHKPYKPFQFIAALFSIRCLSLRCLFWASPFIVSLFSVVYHFIVYWNININLINPINSINLYQFIISLFIATLFIGTRYKPHKLYKP